MKKKLKANQKKKKAKKVKKKKSKPIPKKAIQKKRRKFFRQKKKSKLTPAQRNKLKKLAKKKKDKPKKPEDKAKKKKKKEVIRLKKLQFRVELQQEVVEAIEKGQSTLQKMDTGDNTWIDHYLGVPASNPQIFSEEKTWAERELGDAKFRDDRLTQRVIQLATDFSEKPTAPIHQASKDFAATKAAYRFFSNSKVKAHRILEPHINQTTNRIQSHMTVLAIQDTTSINYHLHHATQGLGSIGKVGHTEIAGLMVHTVFCVSPEGLPLGFIDQLIWARSKKEKIKKPKESEEKESIRWIEAMRNTVQQTQGTSAKVITVCDREADMYDFFLGSPKLKTRCHYEGVP